MGISLIPSIAGGIYSAITGNKKEKEAQKRADEAAKLARESDAKRQAAADQRYRDLGSFRTAAQGALTRAQLAAGREPQQITGGKYGATQDVLLSGINNAAPIGKGDYADQVDAGLKGVSTSPSASPDVTAGEYGQTQKDLLKKSMDNSTVSNGRYMPQIDSALKSVGSSPTAGADIANGRYQDQTEKSLSSLTNGPDRMALVRQAMSDYDTANKAGFESRMRSVGQKAAALGRIGSGLTTSELGDVQSNYERDRMLAASGAIRDAAGQTMGDRLNVSNAMMGANQADLGLQERNRATNYGAARDAQGDRFRTLDAVTGLNRDAQGVEQQNINNNLKNLDAASGLAAQDIGLSKYNADKNYGAARDAQGDRFKVLDTTIGLNKDSQNLQQQNLDNRYKALDATNTLNQQDVGLQRDNRDFTYQAGRDQMSDAKSLAGIGYDNGQVVDTANTANSINAANNQANRADAAAERYGKGFSDSMGALGSALAQRTTGYRPAPDLSKFDSSRYTTLPLDPTKYNKPLR